MIALVKLPKTKRVAKLSFSFLLAGALGNMVDRIAFNYVRDFVDFPWFANCNFADFFITAGFHTLFNNDNLFEGIHGLIKRCGFLFVLGLIGNRIRGLNIVFFATESSNEVNLELDAGFFSVCVSFT